MEINKLEIKGFGKLNNLTLNFSKGLNIVYGKNESGKSSIQMFIKGMIFGLKGGRGGKDGIQAPLKKYKPWDGNDYNGFIEYKLGSGEVYRIGRNFSNGTVRVFDSLFNDITGSFDVSRDRGPQFAETHLGIGEVCFDKTVFIKQMESRVDDDGSKELLNRLMNVSQTGFEDISFTKAQNVLKEALKSYVGTDKTTTRPLDKVLLRLEELKGIKERLIGRRNNLFDMENDLNEAVIIRDRLENRKFVLTQAKSLIEFRETLAESKRLKDDLFEALGNIKCEEEELKVISNKIEDFNKMKEQFAKFANYEFEDIDQLNSQYHKLHSLMEENRRIDAEIERKKIDIERTEYQLRPVRAFDNLDGDAENTVIGLSKELENLKAEYDKSDVEVLNEKISSRRSKSRLMGYNIALSTVAAILFLAAGIFGFQPGFIIAPFAIAGICILTSVKIRIGKELSGLEARKKSSFVFVNGVVDEINKRQSKIKEILGIAGAESIESFLKMKAAYDSKNQQLKSLNKDIERLETDFRQNESKIKEMKKSVMEVLTATGAEGLKFEEIKEEHIKNFKYGVNRYRGLEPSFNYAMQRTQDLKTDLKRLYKKASILCGFECNDKEQIEKAIEEADEKIKIVEGNQEGVIELIREKYIERGFAEEDFEGFKDKYLNSELDEADFSLTYEYNKLTEELNDILLRIKEYETLLKNSTSDDDIQRVDEEIEELEARKNELEDLNISLKTALEILTEASMEIQRDFVPFLNNRMSGIINSITGGRYKDMRADDRLGLKVICPDTGDVVPAAALSGGTVDQVYLALRLAMADIIASTGEKLPFVMDEVFAQYDDARTRETLRFINELCEERQVILFTCKGREIEIAKEICGNKMNLIEL